MIFLGTFSWGLLKEVSNNLFEIITQTRKLNLLCICSSFRREYGEKMSIKFTFLSEVLYGKTLIYGTNHLKRKENLMSSSDDYHRHRLRTATKYFKVSLKPFQRLGRVRGGSPRKGAWQGAGRQPREIKNQWYLGSQSPCASMRSSHIETISSILSSEEVCGSSIAA